MATAIYRLHEAGRVGDEADLVLRQHGLHLHRQAGAVGGSEVHLRVLKEIQSSELSWSQKPTKKMF